MRKRNLLPVGTNVITKTDLMGVKKGIIDHIDADDKVFPYFIRTELGSYVWMTENEVEELKND